MTRPRRGAAGGRPISVLERGARGRHGRAPFTLAGVTRVRNEQGAEWNEWLVRYDDGRVAFLAEAQGAFTLYEERPIAPDPGALTVGAPLDTGFVVVERGRAERVARHGDVLDAPRRYRYADLSSRAGERATIDWGEAEPRVYVGGRVTLKALGLRASAEAGSFVPASAAPPKGTAIWLSPGDEGSLRGARFRVVGVLGRSTREDGERYAWQEYLLHAPAEGLRWLVVADGHWTFVESLEPGLVEEDERGAVYDGERFRRLAEGKARVDWAVGELPWPAARGDVSQTRDYVRAPLTLSREWTEDELTWSLGTYTPADDVARAFGKSVMPWPEGRAPNQPRRR